MNSLSIYLNNIVNKNRARSDTKFNPDRPYKFALLKQNSSCEKNITIRDIVQILQISRKDFPILMSILRQCGIDLQGINQDMGIMNYRQLLDVFKAWPDQNMAQLLIYYHEEIDKIVR